MVNLLELTKVVRKLFKQKGYRATFEELAYDLNLSVKECDTLKLILEKLELGGEIYLTDSQEYISFPRNTNLSIGEVRFNRQQKPFILVGQNVVSILENHLNGAIKGDMVLIKRSNFSELGENLAVVEKILDRKNHFMIFECYKDGKKKKVRPYNSPFKCPISISGKDWSTLNIGERFAVHIDTINHNGIFHGDILFKIGKKEDPLLTLKTIAASHGIRIGFPKEVEEEAKQLPTTISTKEIQAELQKGRIDLRDKIIFTIDGKDSKDLDDAVSLEINEKGNYVLGVHIADVPYYVKEGSAIQKEAEIRGTSYYFSDLVIPMLPSELSNGICSLNPNVDRFTRTREIEISPIGEIISFQLYKSIIHSRKKMAYEDINKIFDGQGTPADYMEFLVVLRQMQQLSAQLDRRKEQRGYINFGVSDFFIKTDETGKPKDIIPRTRGSAESLIENFMLLSNEMTAIYQQNMHNLPFIYRVHGFPDEKRIAEVLTYLENSGYKIERKDYHDPKNFQQLLKSLAASPAFPVLSEMLIRGLSKAKYSVHNTGHYGLALGFYTHCTSPIRRYSDLQTQYNIDKYKEQSLDELDVDSQTEKMVKICKHTTQVEKIADTTDRDITGYQCVQYMESKVGKEFTGIVAYVNRNHLLIRTSDGITGTLDTDELLNLGYRLVDQGTTLVSPNEEEHIRIGSFLQVVLKETCLETRKIIFTLSKKKVYIKEPSI